MRLRHLLFWDMKFQVRYGFYLLYGFLTVLYAAVLVSLPLSWQENAAAILIFSDPAAMGLFFMGAIILLEKSQRVTTFFSVSPLKAWEYVSSKVLSLSMIALLVAAVLGVTAKCSRLSMVLLGTFLSSVLFTLLGLVIASKITSLNQFLLATVPVEILVFLPAALHLFGVTPAFLRFYPASVCMDLIAGRACSVSGLILTAALIGLLYFVACDCVLKMWTGAEAVLAPYYALFDLFFASLTPAMFCFISAMLTLCGFTTLELSKTQSNNSDYSDTNPFFSVWTGKELCIPPY